MGQTVGDWQEISASKRKALADSIPPEWRIPISKLPPDTVLDVTSFPKDSGILTSTELEMTSTPATQLLTNLHSQIWTCETVTTAFSKRAALAQQLTNCLSETLFDRALSRAKELDAHLHATGKPIGPLHGLPISIKDNFQIKGLDSTDGFSAWVNQPATTNSTLVDILLELGAVLYVKTNVPTAMMIAETVNNVFGRTVHPKNRNLTSGGSSGGESALIAFGGSVLGIGTDIGGSLRIPAACTGLFTLKPSFGRFPTGGAKSGLAGQEAVSSINGPLGRSLEEVELFSRVVVGSQPWKVDPKCLPIPWREVEVPKKLKLGVLWHDGVVKPTPPVLRALKKTVDKIRGAGHEVIDWAPSLHPEILQKLGKFFTADGGETLRSILSPTSEPFRPELKAYETATALSVAEMWRLQAQRTSLMTQYLKRWQDAGIDGIICATTPWAAVENGKFRHVGYTGVWNVLDHSCTSFPYGINVDKEVDGKWESEGILSELDEKIRAEYNVDAVHGMPVSLQLVAGRLEEEKVLAMTKKVLETLP